MGWSSGASAAIATDTTFNAKGDIVAATADNAAAVVTVGANGTLLTADSTASTGVAWKSQIMGSAVIAETQTIGTTSGAQTLCTLGTIPAARLAQGYVVRFGWGGYFTLINSATARSLEIKVLVGGVLLCDTGAIALSTSASRATAPIAFEGFFTVRSIGASGVIAGGAQLSIGDIVGAAGQRGNWFTDGFNWATATVDTTGALAVTATATWTVSNAVADLMDTEAAYVHLIT